MNDQLLRELEREWRSSDRPDCRAAYLRELRKRGDRLCLVIRSAALEPMLKKLVPLNAGSIIEWFGRGIMEISQRLSAIEDPEKRDSTELNRVTEEWLFQEIGLPCPVLTQVFKDSIEYRHFPATSLSELKENIEFSFGNSVSISEDEEVLCINLPDWEFLEPKQTYNFISRAYANIDPARFSYLFLEDWKLPQRVEDNGEFRTSQPTKVISPSGSSDGVIYFSLLSGYDYYIPEGGYVWSLEGLRLPELLAYLRGVCPRVWPEELFAIRAGVVEGDVDLLGAIKRCDRIGVFRLADLSTGSYEEMHEARLETGADWQAHDKYESETPVFASEHLIQTKTGFSDCFQAQWIIFDDLWASTYPALAESIIRFALKQELFDSIVES